MAVFTAVKARKSHVILRINLQGPAGSGKSRGALELGRNLAELVAVGKGRKPSEAKIAAIDTENESLLLYADVVDFDHCPVDPPFTTARMKEAIKAMVDAGYEVIVLDSISHWWKGILSRKEQYDLANPKSNSFTNWGRFTPEIEDLIEYIKRVPVHIIFSARSKTDIVLQPNDKGKMVPVKVGMKPVLKEDMDYEFDLVFELDAEHGATATKDRTALFAGSPDTVSLLNRDVAVLLYEWATSGQEATVRVLSPEDRRRIFNAAKAHNIDGEVLKSYLHEALGVDDSTKIPASQVQNVIRWIESPAAKGAARSPEEHRAYEAADILQYTAREREVLFEQMKHDWAAINAFLSAEIDKQS